MASHRSDKPLDMEDQDEYKLRITAELQNMTLSKSKVSDSPVKTKSTVRKPKRRGSSMNVKPQTFDRKSIDEPSKIEAFLRLSKKLTTTPQIVPQELENELKHVSVQSKEGHSERMKYPTISAPLEAHEEPVKGGDPFSHQFGTVEDDLNNRQMPPPIMRLSALSQRVPGTGEFVERSEAYVFAPRPGTRPLEASVGSDPANDIVVSNPGVSSMHAIFSVDSAGRVALCDLGRSPYGCTVNPSNAFSEGMLLCQGSIDLQPGDTVIVGDPRRAITVFILEVKRHHHHATRGHSRHNDETLNSESQCDGHSKSAGGPTHPHEAVGALRSLPLAADRLVEQMLSSFAPPRAWTSIEGENEPGLPGVQGSALTASTRRRSVVREAYLSYEKFKPELRQRLKKALLERSNLFHVFRAKFLSPLMLVYAKCKLRTSLRRWFARAQIEHCGQRILFRRLAMILRAHMMRRGWDLWMKMLNGGRVSSDPALVRLKFVTSFYRWKRKTREFSRTYTIMYRLIIAARIRVMKAAFNSWLWAAATHWLAQNRTFGLAKMLIRGFMRRRFRRWAMHISHRAAVWRVRRNRMTFDILSIARLRILKTAKRFWRYRVGLEAWWSWAGEMGEPNIENRQAAVKRLALLRAHAHENLSPPTLVPHSHTQPLIAFEHGDEEDNSTLMAGIQWTDPCWLGAARYGDAQHGVVEQRGRVVEDGWHLHEFGDPGTLRREGFRSAASAHEQWWYWLTTAQRHCVTMVRRASFQAEKDSRWGKNEVDCVSAVEAADEFLARAWGQNSMQTGGQVWAKNLEVTTQRECPRLAPRSFQAKSEVGRLRRIRRRASGGESGRASESTRGVKWGTLVVWLPGGTRVSVDLYGDEASETPAATQRTSTMKAKRRMSVKPTRIAKFERRAMEEHAKLLEEDDIALEQHRTINASTANDMLCSPANKLLMKFSSLANQLETEIGNISEAREQEKKNNLSLVKDEDSDPTTIHSSSMSLHSNSDVSEGSEEDLDSIPTESEEKDIKKEEGVSKVGRLDMLAFVDILRSHGSRKPSTISRIVAAKTAARRWKHKVFHQLVWADNGSINSFLSILAACQALELAGASLVSKRMEKLSKCKHETKREDSVFKVYLRAHSTHFAVAVDHPEDRRSEEGDRRIAAIKHFNVSNWEVAMFLIETLLNEPK